MYSSLAVMDGKRQAQQFFAVYLLFKKMGVLGQRDGRIGGSLLIVFSHLTAFLRYFGTSLQFVSSAAAEVQQQGSGGGNRSATHPLPPGAKTLREQPQLKDK